MPIIEKFLTTQIDTKDPDILYTLDPTATLKTLLTTRFVNKCFKRCFILEITEIVRYSPFVCEWNRTGGSARIAISFRVNGMQYDKYEVIPDCKIIEIMEDGKILLKNKIAAVMLMPNAKLQSYRVGHIVPVRVYDARYVPNRHLISVQAVPFTPLRLELAVFDIAILDEDQKILEPMIARLAEEQARFAAVDAKVAAKITKLLDPKTPAKHDNFKPIEIKLITGTGRVTRADHSALGSTTVLWQAVDAPKVETRNSVQVLRGYLNSAIKDVALAVALAETYDFTEKNNEPWMDLYTS
jgi:hypothetical protein